MRRLSVLFVIALVIAAATGCGDLAPNINSASPQPELQVLKGSTNSFAINAEDPEGQTLTYQWSATSGTPQTSTAADFNWTAPSEVGVSNISVAVSDGKNSTTHTWRVSVVQVLASMTTISGVVYGSAPNTVICKATVAAELTGGARFTALTDMNGVYTLHVPIGQYSLTAEKESFNPSTVQLTASGASAVVQDFTLTTGSGGTITFPTANKTIQGYTMPDTMDYRTVNRSAPTGYKCAGNVYLYVTTPESPTKGFRLYRSDSFSGVYTLIKTFSVELARTPSLSLDDEDPSFTPGQQVWYRLAAWGDGGESVLTGSYQVTFLNPVILSLPANAASVNVGTSPIFSWSTVDGASIYFVYLEKWNGSGWTYIWSGSSATGSLTYTGSALTEGVYQWKVEAQGSNSHTVSYLRKFTVIP